MADLTCDECGERLGRFTRADALYCSSPCRQRAYRRRKRILAPYSGDARAGLTAALAGLRAFLDEHPVPVTATSRNADPKD